MYLKVATLSVSLFLLSVGVASLPADPPTRRHMSAMELWFTKRQTQCSSTQNVACCNTGNESCTVVDPAFGTGNESIDFLEEPCSPPTTVSCCSQDNEQNGLININIFFCNPMAPELPEPEDEE